MSTWYTNLMQTYTTCWIAHWMRPLYRLQTIWNVQFPFKIQHKDYRWHHLQLLLHGLLKSFGGSDFPVTIIAGTSEDPFYGEGTRGRVTENFSSLGLGGITGTMLSRTDEVARCIQLMQQSCIDNDLSSEVTISSFLNHSFEEICWQAHDSRRAVVVVLLNPSSHQNQSRSAMLR
ncbi:uncharacterized protein LOC141874074 isoform X2 [Acropora palmata]|uniref:uncharacterized protein LOC141874074 isoform X2 n=1 Tax=Acropora palmata TaxID=6131 RepID=UPI003D9FF970